MGTVGKPIGVKATGCFQGPGPWGVVLTVTGLEMKTVEAILVAVSHYGSSESFRQQQCVSRLLSLHRTTENLGVQEHIRRQKVKA